MTIDLAKKLHALARPRVLVVGDRMVDRDHHGQEERYAQEAAGCPVFTVEHTTERRGGAGAVAEMAAALGAEVDLVAGERCAARTRYFAGGRQVWRRDDAPAPLSAAEWSELAEQVELAALSADVVLVADYGQGACTPAVLRAAIGAAADRRIPCLVDPARGRHWSHYRGATCVKCNWHEFDGGDVGALENGTELIVTAGDRGLRWLGQGGAREFRARPRNVVDVTGAGDMVLAALGVGIGSGLSWPEACTFAVAASGCKVERHGAAPVSRAEVVEDLLHGSKVVPAALLPAIAAARRTRGHRIAFTNGCFDVLHAGHVQYLQEARAEGDVLVVALNGDADVARLKGSGRPFHGAADRAAVLAGLAAVDYVVEFSGEAELEKLIGTLRPDVLVKGSDYAWAPITGAALVESYGGRVFLTAMRPGLSTTRILS
jgi:D-beta-D-heptose 7-phosphate kinase/D-beta-D-heptose 1-phosphate adenosyltransferase